MYILTETEMLFCYWKLNYTFFSCVFQMRSRIYGVSVKGDTGKILIQIYNPFPIHSLNQ